MDTKTPRVLLVEDSTFMQDMYSLKFKKAGFDFHGLTNIDDEFPKKVIEINPDLILMDIHFEGSENNGVGAAENLRLDEKTKMIPIIFFTNADIEELAQRAQKLGSSIGFLVKSAYTPSEVVLKVRELYDKFSKQK